MKHLGIIALAVVMFVATPVRSHERTFTDQPDNDDAPLNIAAVSVNHVRRHRTGNLIFTVETAKAFTNEVLGNVEGYQAASIGVSTDPDKGFERLIYLDIQPDSQDLSGYSLVVVITKGPRESDADLNPYTIRRAFVGYGSASRPSDTTIRFSIPERTLSKDGLDRFRWGVRLVSQPDSSTITFDYLEGRGHS